MKIIFQKSRYHRFALFYEYSQDKVDFCRQLKDTFGWERFSFSVEGELKFWAFSDSILIPVLAEKFPEIEISHEVRSIVEQEQIWLNNIKKKKDDVSIIKSKEKTDFNIKGLKGKLYEYQKIGVEFLVASGGRAIIADSPGCGKSAQAIAYAKHTKFKRVLIVSPASVKFAWKSEIEKWTNMSSVIIDSNTDISKIDPDINFWIINYDLLKKHFKQLSKTRFCSVFGDECQYIKSTSTLRTKAFRALSRDIKSVVLLSGTPLLSRPAELFSLLNIIDPKTWSDWYGYARRFCAMKQTRWGLDTSGASNIGELHEKIKRYFIRRDKSQVLKELPPKNFIDIPVKLDRSIEKEYREVAEDLAKYLRDNMGMKKADVSKSMSAEKLVQLNLLRKLCAQGKINVAKELATSITDSGEKVLIFSSFIEPLKTLKEFFKEEAVMISGETPVQERGEIVKAFQTNKNIKIFLGGYKSAGTGITLTAAQNFIGIDYPWNPADLQQSHDRLHRPSQTASNVNIYQLVTIDTIDEDMKGILDTKQGIFDQVIEGKKNKNSETAMDSALNRVLKNY
jgi:SWI/SNF-related matrix-associated actin-dependent regulator 1 of chromatin subfamily A